MGSESVKRISTSIHTHILYSVRVYSYTGFDLSADREDYVVKVRAVALHFRIGEQPDGDVRVRRRGHVDGRAGAGVVEVFAVRATHQLSRLFVAQRVRRQARELREHFARVGRQTVHRYTRTITKYHYCLG